MLLFSAYCTFKPEYFPFVLSCHCHSLSFTRPCEWHSALKRRVTWNAGRI